MSDREKNDYFPCQWYSFKEKDMTEISFFSGTAGHQALVSSSYKINREYEQDLERGRTSSYTSYVPSKWDQDGTKELMDGWKETWGTCSKCFTLRSASGACNC